MGIIGMKVPARGRILSSWTPPSLEEQKHLWEGVVPARGPGTLQMREAMYYTLSLPVSTVIIGCDKHCATGGERANGPRLYAAQRRANGGHFPKGRTRLKTGPLFPLF